MLCHQFLESDHKNLRFCDLCKELAFASQGVGCKRSFLYNSFVFSELYRQFLESTPLGLRHLLRERNFPSGRRVWCNGARALQRAFKAPLLCRSWLPPGST
jgi:hypothetical protein